MQTRSQPETESRLGTIATILRWVSWLSLWGQLAFALASALMLGIAVSGRQFNQALAPIFGARVIDGESVNTPGLGIGMFFASCSIAVMLFGIFVALRQARFAKRLRSPNSSVHPRKVEVTELLRLATLTGLAGLLLALLGEGASLAVLLAKAIAQVPGAAFYDPSRVIRSLDIFVPMANLNGLAGHLTGTVAALGLLNWLHRS
ncbi:MAG: DUF3611 family protein [Leptolyngbyaceae cyanobacterium bins.59]|nr:DUF3611 family protein [Leptolyngbyaceae cyanobacterium bins.59]